MVVGVSRIKTPTSSTSSPLANFHVGIQWTSETLRTCSAGGMLPKTLPVKTMNTLPLPTLAGDTQCAAVRTTCGETTSAVHSAPPEEPGTCANIMTTLGSPSS